MSLKTLITILAVSMLTIGTLTPALAVSPKAYSFEDTLEVEMPGTSDEQLYVPGEILVKFIPGVSEEKIKAINSKNGASVTYTSPYAGFKKLKIPKTKTVEEMVEIYSKNPNVEYAVPNYVMHASMQPNDYYYGLQWNFHSSNGINIEPAWDISTGKGVVVAVLDTGVAYNAPDLANTNFVEGYDYINNDNDPTDDQGHGTHVSGTIAQSTNNGIGVAGVAFDCSIMPVKVLGADGSGTLGSLVEGIYYASDNGAQVISMSLGFPLTVKEEQLAPLFSALNYAYNKEMVIVAAAGNDGESMVSYPAAYYKCIAVGATRYDGERAYYSNYGSALDVMAPGGDVTVDQSGDGYGDGILQNTFDNTRFGYWFYQGTSMATPHVSGVAALLIANGVTNPDQVREAIENSAQDIYVSGWDSDSGHGIVDAYASLTYFEEIPNQAPSAVMDIPYVAYIGETITFDASNSTDPDGEITSYYWDFGDGSNASGASVTHGYYDFNDYIINLTVTDDKGATDTATGSIAIVPPNEAPIAVMSIPESTNVGETVNFDASASEDTDGGIMDYSWDFGDGSFGSGISATHTYNVAGDYTVELTVTDYEGATNTTSGTITVIQPNRPPIADMDMPSSAYVNDVVAFDASGSTDPEGDSMTFTWNFGDGNTSVEMSPQHTYDTAGTYDVTLTVTDNEGLTNTSLGSIVISDVPVNEPPVAIITMPASADVDETINFIAMDSYDSDGTIVSYYWDFGDNSEGANTEQATHAYSTDGTYMVTLTVTDDDGATGSATGTVQIDPISDPQQIEVTIVDMEYNVKYAGRNLFVSGTATVNVTGVPAGDVIISGHWSDATADLDSVITSTGTATVDSDWVKYKKGTLIFVFAVDSVTVGDTTYYATEFGDVSGTVKYPV